VPIPPIESEEVTAAARRLATLAQFRERLNVTATGTDTDRQLELLLDGASERLNEYRQFYGSGPSTRTFRVDGSYARISDLRRDEPCTVLADGVELGPGDVRFLFRTKPVPQPAHAIVLYRNVGELEITGHWGFAPTPSGIVNACLEWAGRGYFAAQGRFADVSIDGETGQQSSYFVRTPSAILATLQAYRIPAL
jgi:hypothetical protein